MLRFTLSLALALFCLGARVQAAENAIKAELLANVMAVTPGAQFKLGVQYTIKPGWHTYWKNPGDAGQAPTIKWNLPPGFTVSEIRWPLPVKHEDQGLTNYEYRDSLLLTVFASAPKDLKPGAKIEITAETNWLVCEKNCVPGQAPLAIALTAGDVEVPANKELFDAWEKRLPLYADAPNSPANVKVELNWPSGAMEGKAVVTGTWKEAVSDANFYPPSDENLLVDKLEVKTEGTTTRATFTLKKFDNTPPKQSQLEGALIGKKASGERVGVQVLMALPK